MKSSNWPQAFIFLILGSPQKAFMRRFVEFIFLIYPIFPIQAQKIDKQGTLIVQYTPGHPANTFNPALALGAGIDGHDFGEIKRMLSPENIKTMVSTGLKSLTYRLRTELGQEAWHWNPQGQWSEKEKNQGYWVSDTLSGKPILLSYGYTLPRRGSTFDQAGNTGYSRIDDGNDSTYWKSNPYLDHRFTGVPDSLHPQWVALDLGKAYRVNTLKIHWADPYAVNFYLEYADSSDVDLSGSMKILPAYQKGFWKPIPHGTIKNCQGGLVSIALSGDPKSIRLIRIVCTKSSGTALPGSHDARDSAGYSIRELELGFSEGGKFKDYMVHGRSNSSQTPVFVSTTDSWHRACDRDSDTEQPGLDFIFQSQINQGLPVLYPLPLVYDNPENALASVIYMEKNRYPVQEWELGEEPDGQYISPQDFACLYSRLAKWIHDRDTHYKIGGPSFQSLDIPDSTLEDLFMQRKWIKDFILELKKEGNISLFHFFSFEWYPFDNICNPQAFSLISESSRFEQDFKAITEILPPFFPIYISEYGYSVSAAEPEVRMDGAILNADLVGQFLTMGGKKAYLYGYEPGYLMNETGCSWGNLMLFGIKKNGNIGYSTALYQSARLYSQKWADPSYKKLEVFPCMVNMKERSNRGKVTGYSLRKPNGNWSIMLINRDSSHNMKMNIQIHHTHFNQNLNWKAGVDVYQYSSEQYQWQSHGPLGRPLKNDDPIKKHIQFKGIIDLPPYSITILDEKKRIK